MTKCEPLYGCLVRSFGETSDFFHLERCGCTEPFGSMAEWLEVVKAIRARGNYHAKRVAVRFDGYYFVLCCPRNAYGREDTCLVSPNEAEEFCEMIEREMGMMMGVGAGI